MPSRTAKVSQKGWVVIPAELRKARNIKPGDTVRFVQYGEMISLMPLLKKPEDEAMGLLKKLSKGKGGSMTRALEREHAEQRRREARRRRGR